MDYAPHIERFETVFGHAPSLGARAPGRVNLIGEHTDYNGGYVLPFAIERETVLLARPRGDRALHLFAANLDAKAVLPLTDLKRSPASPWADYVAGVARELLRMDWNLQGADILVFGDVPLGCGLSSSAAFEMATLRLFEQLEDAELTDDEAARLGQRVENDFLGLSSGIMDQFISRAGRAGHALFLDCATLANECVPVNLNDTVFVLADSAQPRGLTSSAYNERVRECGEAVAAINAATGRACTSLREVDLETLYAAEGAMPDVPFRRARHVLTENERTLRARDALTRGDVRELGRLMNASHQSLRDDYAVTGEALDSLTDIARGLEGCHGSRMTGAGFGGCTVSLVEKGQAEVFCRDLVTGYRVASGRDARVFWTEPSEGASALKGYF